ncbi:M16 family metallopeptidase [Adhaeribacter pallidiroseus]|uniref:Putative zinc protease YmxG n=1 Tax=Adhaeribacter pallidiroseus TaxID=2072847 RepID=A0A369QM62_9BACT|nr:pitrilysin family protein [Adhaeribacter pallidiroseus]RDC65430.1 putative zinc protease YmxG [Adhaeribacter pallidiroseus]
MRAYFLPRQKLWLASAALGLGITLSLGACSPKTVSSTTSATPTTTQPTTTSPTTAAYQVAVDYYTLENGLRVILSPDKTTPIVTTAAYYNIGFRNEPKDRTGFAHLFEHMMFQGSQNLGKMEFIQLIQKNGGVLNGSTRFDFTNYFEIVPANKLETILWAEADRMRGLNITQDNLKNQQEVVKNEVKVNVLNQPYGGFPWLDMPQYANKNWFNAHNFYGDLKDLDAANLEDVKSFFKTFYSPNNAALVVTGDFEPEQAKTWIKQYFGNIPSSQLPPKVDLTEPRQEKEQRFSKDDKLATKPALAFAYHMPDRNTPEYYAMGLLDQILLQGHDSRLYQALVQERGYSDAVTGGINSGLGNMFNYNGPMLWDGSLVHDNTVTADSIIMVLDREIKKLETRGIDQALLDLAIVKMRSSFYDQINELYGFGKADMLASFALFDNNPARINTLEAEFRKVTPELMQKTLREYLRPTNRTILTINPLAKS